jgi:thiamine-phosphate pyrophosphorylase
MLPNSHRYPIMCLTQDGLPWSHAEQAQHLCGAGVRWIQVRMKDVTRDYWLQTAKDVARICHRHHALCVINDSVEIARESGADGVHLGKFDGDWKEARLRLGTKAILGGTVNNREDAERARMAGCLDYVGVGPWRFTTNKKNLSPVLGPAGVRAVIAELGDLPAWVIGGIESTDLAEVKSTGAAGAAVSSALYRGGQIETNFSKFQTAWLGPVASKATSIL